MTQEDQPSTDPNDSTPPPEEIPAIEDAYTTQDPLVDEVDEIDEDAPEFLDATARELAADANAEGSDDGVAAARTAEADDTSDTATVPDEPDHPDNVAPKSELPDWTNETSAQRIAVELKRTEAQIRSLLEDRDSKRKRKLGGTRRWKELEDDLTAWRYAGRLDEPTLDRLGEFVTKRHYLFNRLHFLSGTRPTWNT